MIEQPKPLFILGTSYRCGSTLMQRLLNCASDPDTGEDESDRQCWILGEMLQNTVDACISNLDRYQNATVVEYKKLQHEYFSQDPNSWTANFGPPPPEECAIYGRMFYDMIRPPPRFTNVKYYGAKRIFFHDGIIRGLKSMFSDAKFIILTRNLQDSYTSYAKQSWRGMKLGQFAELWGIGISTVDFINKGIESGSYKEEDFIFIDYDDISYDTISDLFDKLGLDNDNIQRVLDKKIGFMPDVPEIELHPSDKYLISMIGPRRD